MNGTNKLEIRNRVEIVNLPIPEFKCVYCNSKNELTIDHVIPKSRGGKNTWENLVTCCKKCNAKKDNKTPKEAGMKLKVKLYRPTYQQFIKGMDSDKSGKWTEYLN